MKVPNTIKAFVRNHLRRHAWNMGVSDYHLDIIYLAKDDGNKLAEIDVRRRYLDGELRLYPSALKKTRAELSKLLAHEVAHIVTDEVYGLMLDRCNTPGGVEMARERLTERISRLATALDIEKMQRKH